MKAMILAAGIGTRLRPLTDTLPKPLMDIGGKTMLEAAIDKLKGAGADLIVVNAFHLADKLEAFIKSRDFGVPVEISREKVLLDTGGGIKNAAKLLRGDKPFFVYNSDILTDFDLRAMYAAHEKSGALATLLCSGRPTTRRFMFSPEGRLCGWENTAENKKLWASAPVEGCRSMGFNCAHVISPALLDKMTEEGVFSINKTYLRLAGEGEHIGFADSGPALWLDIGTPEKLENARNAVRQGKIKI